MSSKTNFYFFNILPDHLISIFIIEMLSYPTVPHLSKKLSKTEYIEEYIQTVNVKWNINRQHAYDNSVCFWLRWHATVCMVVLNARIANRKRVVCTLTHLTNSDTKTNLSFCLHFLNSFFLIFDMNSYIKFTLIFKIISV